VEWPATVSDLCDSEAMHKEGLVVLNNVIPTHLLDKLNEQMCKETDDLMSRPTTHLK
jgi:hypothetical protein